MSKGQLVITAVVVEGRSKSEVARDYDVSRQWVQQLCRRYAAEGATAFGPRSRRPTPVPERCAPGAEDRILRLRKNLTKQGFDAGAETIAAHLAADPPSNVPAVSTIGRILTVETAQAEISLSAVARNSG
jgi:transposase-like protein